MLKATDRFAERNFMVKMLLHSVSVDLGAPSELTAFSCLDSRLKAHGAWLQSSGCALLHRLHLTTAELHVFHDSRS